MSVDDNVVSEEPIDILSYATEILLQPPDNQNCTDFHGKIVEDGAQFVPNVDPCWTCHCQNGVAVMCKSVQCSPPACRIIKVINDECCEFVCADQPHDSENFPDDTNRASFGVRLVASIVTSLIVIFLLVFMVHRIRRRRRTMISIRRLNDERRSENDDLVYMTNADTVDVGFELPPYEDLPPPYSPAKPWDISEESPPPYEPNDGSIIQTDEAALPWRQTDPGRDGTAFPHQISSSTSFPAGGRSDSCTNRPATEDDVLEDGDTETGEGGTGKSGIMRLRALCGYADHCSPSAETLPDTCALHSGVRVCSNGSREPRVLQEIARMKRILGGHDNDFNGNETDAVKATDTLLCSDAAGETRISESRNTQDRTCSNTLEGTSETANDDTLGPAAGKRLRSIRNALGGTDHHHSGRDASGGATRKCLLAEAPAEMVGGISTANAAWVGGGTTKRRYLDYNRQPPTKIHSNKIWCEL